MFTNLINRTADEDRVGFTLIGCPRHSRRDLFPWYRKRFCASLDGRKDARHICGRSFIRRWSSDNRPGLSRIFAGARDRGRRLPIEFCQSIPVCRGDDLGVATHVAGLYLPAADPIVPISVLIAGLMLIIEERIAPAWWMAVFVAAGLFHGYTYGDSIYGAEAAPLVTRQGRDVVQAGDAGVTEDLGCAHR